MSPQSSGASSSSEESERMVALFGEVLDLLAGIEARQKVLAKEIAAIKAFLYNQDHDQVVEALSATFDKNLQIERNQLLNRISSITTLPVQSNPDDRDATAWPDDKVR